MFSGVGNIIVCLFGLCAEATNLDSNFEELIPEYRAAPRRYRRHLHGFECASSA
jgi:hypothetical protein